MSRPPPPTALNRSHSRGSRQKSLSSLRSLLGDITAKLEQDPVTASLFHHHHGHHTNSGVSPQQATTLRRQEEIDREQSTASTNLDGPSSSSALAKPDGDGFHYVGPSPLPRPPTATREQTQESNTTATATASKDQRAAAQPKPSTNGDKHAQQRTKNETEEDAAMDARFAMFDVAYQEDDEDEEEQRQPTEPDRRRRTRKEEEEEGQQAVQQEASISSIFNERADTTILVQEPTEIVPIQPPANDSSKTNDDEADPKLMRSDLSRTSANGSGIKIRRKSSITPSQATNSGAGLAPESGKQHSGSQEPSSQSSYGGSKAGMTGGVTHHHHHEGGSPGQDLASQKSVTWASDNNSSLMGTLTAENSAQAFGPVDEEMAEITMMQHRQLSPCFQFPSSGTHQQQQRSPKAVPRSALRHSPKVAQQQQQQNSSHNTSATAPAVVLQPGDLKQNSTSDSALLSLTTPPAVASSRNDTRQEQALREEERSNRGGEGEKGSSTATLPPHNTDDTPQRPIRQSTTMERETFERYRVANRSSSFVVKPTEQREPIFDEKKPAAAADTTVNEAAKGHRRVRSSNSADLKARIFGRVSTLVSRAHTSRHPVHDETEGADDDDDEPPFVEIEVVADKERYEVFAVTGDGPEQRRRDAVKVNSHIVRDVMKRPPKNDSGPMCSTTVKVICGVVVAIVVLVVVGLVVYFFEIYTGSPKVPW